MNQFEPLRLYRNRKTGKVAHDLRVVLPKVLTVRPAYRGTRYTSDDLTLFSEIAFVPKAEAAPPKLRYLFKEPVGTKRMGRSEFLAAMGDAIQTAIEAAWNPKRFHLVFHSGGYDSRIISSAISRLAAEHGRYWLGSLLFVCIGNETETFEHVMQIQGWGPERYHSVPDVGPLVARMVDLADAGRWLNGVTLQAVDYNWVLIEHLQRLGLVPSDGEIQLFSGRNETLMGATMPDGNRLSRFWGEAYESHLAIGRYKCSDVVFPFSAGNVISLALSSTTRMDWSYPEKEEKCHFRRDIGIALNPDLLGIPRRTIEIPDLTQSQFEAMCDQYAASWYGKRIWPGAIFEATRKPLGTHPWWSAFSAAALCEALLEEGHTLNVG